MSANSASAPAPASAVRFDSDVMLLPALQWRRRRKPSLDGTRIISGISCRFQRRRRWSMRFASLVPMLQCDDIGATKAWYESVLGFRSVGMADDGWCRLERDGVAIMFMSNAHLGAPHATATQYIYCDDVVGLWDSIK